MALTDSLISHWKLDEASGNALDAHGSNELTDNNTVGAAAGKLNGSRDLERGNSESFSRADNAALSTGDIDFTFAGWLNFESMPGQMAVICKDNDSTQREYILQWFSNNLSWSVFNAAGSSATAQAAYSTTGAWVFFVVWHDSVANQIGIQLNNGTPVTASHSTGVKDGTAAFQLGARNAGIYFDGLMDAFSLWKRILTSDEKTELYNGGNGLDYDDWADTGEASAAGRLLLLGVG